MRMPPPADINANRQLQLVLENQKLQLAQTAYTQQRQYIRLNSFPESRNTGGNTASVDLQDKSRCKSTEAVLETISDLVDFVADNSESHVNFEAKTRTHKASVTVADGVGSRSASLKLGPSLAVPSLAQRKKEAVISRLEVLVHEW